jgi:hypothetical protein
MLIRGCRRELERGALLNRNSRSIGFIMWLGKTWPYRDSKLGGSVCADSDVISECCGWEMRGYGQSRTSIKKGARRRWEERQLKESELAKRTRAAPPNHTSVGYRPVKHGGLGVLEASLSHTINAVAMQNGRWVWCLFSLFGP